MTRGETDSPAAKLAQAAPALAAVFLALAALLLVPPGSLPYPPESAYSDAAIAHWPSAHFLRQSVWQHGQWPLWNPLRMLGQPFAANPLSKVWYPPQWLVLILPPTLHLNLLIALHVAWAGLGMAAWARAARLGTAAALLGALAWGLNARLAAHLGAGHLDIVYALAWAPWLLWAARRLADAPSARMAVRLGLIGALLALADLRVAFYVFPAAALAGFAPAAISRRGPGMARRLAGGAGLAALVFLLLTAVQTVPLIALGRHLTRAAITPAEAAVFSLPPGHLLGALIADAGGFHEFMTYLGPAVVLLAAAAITRREQRLEALAWLVVAAAGVLWALGENGPLFLPLAGALPGASWFRVPSRAWITVTLAVTVLAVQGFEAVRTGEPGRAGRLAAAGLGLAGLVWLAAVPLAVPAAAGNLAGFGAALAAAGAGLWALGGGLPQRAARRAGGGLLIGTAALSLLLVDVTLVEGRPLEGGAGPDRAIIAALDGSCGPVYSPSFDLIGPAAAQAGIATLHGVDPFQLTWSADLIAGAAGTAREGYGVTAPLIPADRAGAIGLALRDATPDSARLAALGVTHVAARFPITDDGLRLLGRFDGVYLYETTGGPPLLIDPAQPDDALRPTAQRTRAACDRPPNRLLEARFDTLPFDGKALLVIPQSWAPGWRARVDGQPVPVQRVAGGLIGVEVPAWGPHDVQIVYRPAADLAGAAISGAAALALTARGIVRLRRAGRGEREP